MTLVPTQAIAAGRVLSERQWWKVVSSDLFRTRETTAHLLGPNHGAPEPAFSPLLREFSCGLREGRPIEDNEEELLAAYTGPQPPPRWAFDTQAPTTPQRNLSGRVII